MPAAGPTTAKMPSRLSRLPDLAINLTDHLRWSDENILIIDPNVEYQTILGFGGAITQAATYVIAQLPAAKQEEVLNAYYSDQGLRYSMGRVPINSCDYSLSSYAFDNVTDDFSLAYFDTQLSQDQEYVIPFIQRVLKKSNNSHTLKLFASPWSPPAWMKTNNNMTSSDNPCLKQDTRYHQAWAEYLLKWFESYEKMGIPFWGMTLQNEPEFAAPWEACTWTPEQQRDFVKNYIGPLFAAKRPHLNLMAYDHNKDHVLNWARVLFSDEEAAQYLWGIAVHWYSGDQFDHVLATHQEFPNKHIIASEATNCPGVIIGDWSRAEKYAHDIIGDLNAWAEAWMDWNIVLDTQGGPNHLNNYCDAPIIADVQSGNLIYQPMYYYLGHFTRHLPAGRSIRIAHQYSTSNYFDEPIELVVFKLLPEGTSTANSNPSSEQIVVIVMNPTEKNIQFKIKLAGSSTATVNLLPHSIQTITLNRQLLG